MDDYQNRMVLIQKYSDVDQAYNVAIEELNREKTHNSQLITELLELEELVFQQKSEIKAQPDVAQDELFDFMKRTSNGNVNPFKVQMQYFQNLANLTSTITERITNDYKLNSENSLDMLFSEIESLKLTQLELNNTKQTNMQIADGLKSEHIQLCAQFAEEVTNYNNIIEENKFDLDKYKHNLEQMEAECQLKAKELADLNEYLNKLSSEGKVMEEQCELWKENGKSA